MAITVEINGKTYTFRNLEEQVLFLTKELTKVQQSLGNALPDPIEGPEGPQGDTGPQGPEGPRGTGVFGCSSVLPSPTAYIEGDFYVLFSGDLYKKINGSWILQTNLKGPQGSIGPQGGTQVIANPVGSSTDDLEKLDIDGTIYDVLSTVNRNKLSIITWSDNEPHLTTDFKIEAKINWLSGDLYVSNEVTWNLNNIYAIRLQRIGQLQKANGDPLIICENLYDVNEHKRFVEGNGTPLSQEGFTSSYCKWSLSGTHLMCVIAGSISAGTTINNGVQLARFNLSGYIKDKINGVVGNLIEYKNITCIDGSYNTTILGTYLEKNANGLQVVISYDYTAAANTSFRVVFDLLIDME